MIMWCRLCYVNLFYVMLHPKPEFQDMCSCSVAQSCSTLCDPMDCNLPGSSVHEISQARILAWVANSYSRGCSWPRIEPESSASPALADGFFITEPPEKQWQYYGIKSFMEKLLRLDHFNVLNFVSMRYHVHSCKSASISVCCLAKAENKDKNLDREFGQE